ncbi:MAG: hypothetical protein WA890_18590 [Micromonospora sp.]
MSAVIPEELRADFNRAAELVRQLSVVLDRIEHQYGDDDPTGLRYSRTDDDDEPVAAPTREHYGFTVTGREQPVCGDSHHRHNGPCEMYAPTNSPADLRGPKIPRSSLHGRPGSKLSADGGLGRPAAGMGTAAVLGGSAAVPAFPYGGAR